MTNSKDMHVFADILLKKKKSPVDGILEIFCSYEGQ